MRGLIVMLCFISSACVVKRQGIDFEYLPDSEYNEPYLQVSKIDQTRIIGTASKDRLVLHNSHKDTIYIFSPVIENSNMFYSKKNCYLKNGKAIIESYYENYIFDAANSGIRKNSFLEILPKDSLIINIDRSLFSEKFAKHLNSGMFKYFYFIQNGYFKEGLINVKHLNFGQGMLEFSFN